jgi:hypothetical protein
MRRAHRTSASYRHCGTHFAERLPERPAGGSGSGRPCRVTRSRSKVAERRLAGVEPVGWPGARIGQGAPKGTRPSATLRDAPVGATSFPRRLQCGYLGLGATRSRRGRTHDLSLLLASSCRIRSEADGGQSRQSRRPTPEGRHTAAAGRLQNGSSPDGAGGHATAETSAVPRRWSAVGVGGARRSPAPLTLGTWRVVVMR